MNDKIDKGALPLPMLRPPDKLQPEPVYSNKRKRSFTVLDEPGASPAQDEAPPIDTLVTGQSIPELQRLMETGVLSAQVLTRWYLERIRRYDVDRLNAVLEVNPDALRHARTLDQERAEGQVRGPLHGIPILVKDNIATGDKMHTSAGAYALRDWRARRDAFLVAQLRAQGAVILGKTNLSEWANYMDPSMPNGFSTLGGQTCNPYGPFDPLGSSSGSAVAVAAGFAAATVGTETQGSIIAPAEANSIVGLKTSLGLVSRDGIIPLVDWMDVPGPMGRCVTDVAVLLTAMVAVDPNDEATGAAAPLAGFDFSQVLDLGLARKVRVGAIAYGADFAERVLAVLAQRDTPLAGEEREHTVCQLEAMREQARTQIAALHGLQLDVVEIPPDELPAYSSQDMKPIMEYGFREAFARFCAQFGADAPVRTLAGVVALNEHDMANRAPYGHRLLAGAAGTTITPAQYAELSMSVRSRTQSQLDELFARHSIDVLLAGSATRAYAPAGYPALTVPAGYTTEGKPIPATFVGPFLSEPHLLAIGYAFEQVTQRDGSRRQAKLSLLRAGPRRRLTIPSSNNSHYNAKGTSVQHGQPTGPQAAG